MCDKALCLLFSEQSNYNTDQYFIVDRQMVILSPIRMRKKYTRVNILRCVFILRCANQPESKFKLCSHGFYRQEYFCR